jgi:UDP-N-acetylglucosamine acyltransferase
MIVDGNPAVTRTINRVGLERNGIPMESIRALGLAYKLLFREGLSQPNALERIEVELPQTPEIKHLLRFARETQRGMTKS